VYLIAPAAVDNAHVAKRKIVEATCEALGLSVVSGSYAPHQAFRLESLKDELSKCVLALVDLSFERPSCYFELGIVETSRVLTKVVAEHGTPIHQTSYRERVRYYSNLTEFKDLVADCLQDALQQASIAQEVG
jgi:hypothetical protein